MIPHDFTRFAERQFLKLPRDLQRRILHKLDHYLNEPDPLAFAEPIAGSSTPAYRFRIGEYRVIFDWEVTRILITKVGHRRDIYR